MNTRIGSDAQDGAVDPITLSVVRYKLLAIAEEVVEVMTQTSFSPMLNQSRDFSAGLLDRDGHLVAQAERVPIHMGALSAAVRKMIEAFGADLREGDVLIANDPYWGGSHLPDVTLAAPLFVDGHPVLWVANRAHQSDIGGISPGGYSPSAKEIWHEGIRIPPMKLVERGAVRQDLLRMICANSRSPEDMTGDLMAQLSSVGRGVERAAGLFRHYGAADMARCLAAILDAGERAMRAQFARWRPGAYEGVSHLDPHAAYDAPLPVRVRITLTPERAIVDFRECGDQLPSYINSPLANTRAAVNVAFMYLSETQDAQNDGSARAIEVLTRPGSFVDPQPPAAVTACTTLTASVIIEAVMKALEPAAPGRVVAGFARRFRLAIGGTDRNGRRFIWHTFANRGGAGAHADADGWSNLGVIHNPGGSPSPSVERTESAYPFLIETYALRPDSGGAGMRRGGLGGRYVLRYEGSTPASITPTGDGADIAPYGLAGGADGAPHLFFIERGGVRSKLGAKDAGLVLMPGDRVVCLSAGGGGYGPPARRPEEARRRDIAYGYVTSQEERQ
ncbi:hydantoinase B/oxoprolinase family protein [Pigmentiphaga soli]|uniref:Hydantoinase B/oxoprolinase family protein n=1 Tax=Pigmentiphaga soli TaxID=1007095 RepID=A0ABP8GEX4_9BURK